MTERNIKKFEASFDPETISNTNAKYCNVLQTNYSAKIRHIFLWAITLNAIKTLPTGSIYTHLIGKNVGKKF